MKNITKIIGLLIEEGYEITYKEQPDGTTGIGFRDEKAIYSKNTALGYISKATKTKLEKKYNITFAKQY